MDKYEYDLIQQALSDHLQRVSIELPINRHERDLYQKAVLACKSVVSKTAIKEWEPNRYNR